MQTRYSHSLFACAAIGCTSRVYAGLRLAVFACGTAFLRLCGRSPFLAVFFVCNYIPAFMRPVSVWLIFACAIVFLRYNACSVLPCAICAGC